MVTLPDGVIIIGGRNNFPAISYKLVNFSEWRALSDPVIQLTFAKLGFDMKPIHSLTVVPENWLCDFECPGRTTAGFQNACD